MYLLYIFLQEKQNYIPEELGRDAQSVAALQRKHANFEQDLVTLDSQVCTVKPVLSSHSKRSKSQIAAYCKSKVLQNALLEHSAILLTCIKR